MHNVANRQWDSSVTSAEITYTLNAGETLARNNAEILLLVSRVLLALLSNGSKVDVLGLDSAANSNEYLSDCGAKVLKLSIGSRSS